MVPGESEGSSSVGLLWRRMGQYYQRALDDVTPHSTGRWAFAVFLVLVFLCRIFFAQVSIKENLTI